jgi:hypothetical protein
MGEQPFDKAQSFKPLLLRNSEEWASIDRLSLGVRLNHIAAEFKPKEIAHGPTLLISTQT